MTLPTWDELLDAGMTSKEAAERRGTQSTTAYKAAHNRGRKWNADKDGRRKANEAATAAVRRKLGFPRPSYDGPSAWVDLAREENRLMRINNGL